MIDLSSNSGHATTNEDVDEQRLERPYVSEDSPEESVTSGGGTTEEHGSARRSTLEKEVSQLTGEVRDMIKGMEGFMKNFTQTKGVPKPKTNSEVKPLQSTPISHLKKVGESIHLTSSFDVSSQSRELSQPSTIYDSLSYNYYVDAESIMVDGHEETCAYINDIRKRFTDADRAEELPYIKNPSQEVERVFIANYSALSTKLNRTPAEEMRLKRYNVSKFPSIKERDTESFYYWIQKLVWYKHKYFIPDYLIRNEILEVAQSLKDPGLATVVRASCKKMNNSQSSPIRYDLIFARWERRLTDDKHDVIIGEIKDILRLEIDPKSMVLTIRAEIDTYLGTNGINDLPLLTWVRIFKMLFNELGEFMDQIMEYMKPVVKVTRPSKNGKVPIVELDGNEIKAHLESVKRGTQKQILATEMTVTYPEIWEAINATCTERASFIRYSTKSKKSNITTETLCYVCGKGAHDIVNCHSVKRAMKEGKVTLKNGQLFSSSGKELEVKESEIMINKYAELFQDTAMHLPNE